MYRVPPISAEDWEERKTLAKRRVECKGQVHEITCRATIMDVFRVEEKLDLDNAIQTKAEFSCAMR